MLEKSEKIFIDIDSELRESTLLLEFQFHDVCNIKCSYCKLNSGKNILEKKYLDNLILFINDYELQNKFTNIEIMIMGGETFLNLPILTELFDTIHNLNNIIPVSQILLLSNFILPTDLITEQMRYLKSFGIPIDLEITLHAQEYSYTQLRLFLKNYKLFRNEISSINVLEGNIKYTKESKFLTLYKIIINTFLKDKKIINNVYICDINKIKKDGLSFKEESNILSNYGIIMSNLGNLFMEYNSDNSRNSEPITLGKLNKFIGDSNYSCECNVKNNLVLDATGHLRWCGNFDQFQEDVIPNIKMIPEDFKKIYSYFFTDCSIRCPYSLCMGGVFNQLKIKEKK